MVLPGQVLEIRAGVPRQIEARILEAKKELAYCAPRPTLATPCGPAPVGGGARQRSSEPKSPRRQILTTSPGAQVSRGSSLRLSNPASSMHDLSLCRRSRRAYRASVRSGRCPSEGKPTPGARRLSPEIIARKAQRPGILALAVFAERGSRRGKVSSARLGVPSITVRTPIRPHVGAAVASQPRAPRLAPANRITRHGRVSAPQSTLDRPNKKPRNGKPQRGKSHDKCSQSTPA